MCCFIKLITQVLIVNSDTFKYISSIYSIHVTLNVFFFIMLRTTFLQYGCEKIVDLYTGLRVMSLDGKCPVNLVFSKKQSIQDFFKPVFSSLILLFLPSSLTFSLIHHFFYPSIHPKLKIKIILCRRLTINRC